MKKYIFSLLLFAVSLTAFSQAPDTLTPEKNARYKIARIRDNSVRAITPTDFRSAFNSLLDMAMNRIPFLTLEQFRAGKADNAAVISVLNNGKVYTFKYDAINTAADDGATVLVQGGRHYVINSDFFTPEMFGAVVNDQTLDLLPIQKALTAAASLNVKRVRISNGFYLINGSINIPTGVHLQGEGYLSEIRSTGTGVYPSLKNLDFLSGNDDITISDLTVNGDRAQRGLGEDAGSHGIRIQAADTASVDRLKIHNVWVKNMPCAGIMLFNVKDSNVSENKITDTMRDGITTWFNSRKISFSNNIMTDIRDDGYGINSEVTGHSGTIAKDISITGGQISHASDSHYGSAVRVAGAWDVSVTGVNVSNIQGHGFLVEGAFLTDAPSKRVSITACTAFNTGFNPAAGGHGIAVSNGVGVTLTSNSIQEYYLNGINLSIKAKGVSVSNNIILDGVNTNGVGILVEGEGNNITSNSISNTKSFGIRLLGNDNSIVGNTLTDCSAANPGNAYIVVSAGINYSSIVGNKLRKITATAGTYGVRISTGASAGNIVTANNTRGFAAGSGVSSSGTGINTVNNNIDNLQGGHTGMEQPLRAVSTNAAILLTEHTILVDAAGAARIVTLPTAASAFSNGLGKIYKIVKTDSTANTVTIKGAGTDLINNANELVLSESGAFIDVQSTGTKYVIIGR